MVERRDLGTTSTPFRPDRDLTRRVAQTWLVLVAVPMSYGLLAGLALDAAIGVPWWVGLALPPAVGALLYVGGGNLVLPSSVSVSGPGDDERHLSAAVARLCALIDMPKPTVRVLEADWPNALTLRLPGRPPTVMVTRGLLDSVDSPSMDAVLAHELAHIRHRDATVMTFAVHFSTGMAFLPILAFHPLMVVDTLVCLTARACGYGWSEMSDEGDLSAPRQVPRGLKVVFGCTIMVVLVAVRAVAVLVFLVLAVTVLPVSLLLALPSLAVTARLNRHREFAADRTAAMVTGSPAELAATLTDLDSRAATYTVGPKLAERLNRLSAMTIVSVPASNEDEGRQPGGTRFLSRLAEPRPALQPRVDRLAQMTRDLGGI